MSSKDVFHGKLFFILLKCYLHHIYCVGDELKYLNEHICKISTGRKDSYTQEKKKEKNNRC